MVAGKNGRPSIILDRKFKVWLGNTSQEECVFEAMEVCGFNTGTFEYKICPGKRDVSGLPWRLGSHYDFFSWNKTLMPVCHFMHQ